MQKTDSLLILLLMLALVGGPKVGLVGLGLLSVYLWWDDIVVGWDRMLERLLERI